MYANFGRCLGDVWAKFGRSNNRLTNDKGKGKGEGKGKGRGKGYVAIFAQATFKHARSLAMAGKGSGSSNESASGQIVEAVTESRSPEHCPSSITLRALFDDRANQAFPQGGVADVAVDTYEIDFRLAEIQRALVAHDAINGQLSMMGG